MRKPWVAVIIGSENDKKKIDGSKLKEIFDYCGVGYALSVFSAHRHRELLEKYCEDAVSRDVGLFIAGAGMSAHLPGSIATITDYKIMVFGVAISSTAFPNALDAMLSISRMPSGCPVAFAGIDNHGFTNAAMMACQAIGIGDDVVSQKILDNLAIYRRIHSVNSEEGYDTS